MKLVLGATLALALALLVAVAADRAARAPVELLVVPKEPSLRADAVAVHGGGGESADRERAAVDLWRSGKAERIVAMGGALPGRDPDVTYARAVERRLQRLGVPPGAVLPLPEGSSSVEELIALRALAERSGWSNVVLATSRWHSRRINVVAEQVFAGSPVAWGVVLPPAGELDAARWWWRDPATRGLVAGEWLKIGLALALPAEPPR